MLHADDVLAEVVELAEGDGILAAALGEVDVEVGSVGLRELEHLDLDFDDTLDEVGVVVAPCQHEISLKLLVSPYHIDVVAGDVETFFVGDFGDYGVSDDVRESIVYIEFGLLEDCCCPTDQPLKLGVHLHVLFELQLRLFLVSNVTGELDNVLPLELGLAPLESPPEHAAEIHIPLERVFGVGVEIDEPREHDVHFLLEQLLLVGS